MFLSFSCVGKLSPLQSTFQKINVGETVTEIFELDMPNQLTGYEYLRVAVSNDEYKRIIYRELKLPNDY